MLCYGANKSWFPVLLLRPLRSNRRPKTEGRPGWGVARLLPGSLFSSHKHGLFKFIISISCSILTFVQFHIMFQLFVDCLFTFIISLVVQKHGNRSKNNWYAAKFFFCEFLNLVNVIGQVRKVPQRPEMPGNDRII